MWRRDFPSLVLHPTIPSGHFISLLVNWRSFGLLAALLAAGFGSVAAETASKDGARQAIAGGVEPLPPESGFTQSAEAGGVGESRGEVRGGAATWLPHTTSASWREPATHRQDLQYPGPWSPPAQGHVLAHRRGPWSSPAQGHVLAHRRGPWSPLAQGHVLAHRRGPWSSPDQGHVLAHRRERIHGSPSPETYFALKGGGLRIGEDPSTDGVFFGAEIGGSIERVLEVGFSLDYYYRSTDNALVFAESSFENLPVELVTFERTAAHLVPLGLTLRLRLPIAGDVVTPIVSTTLAYEMLFLENVGGALDDPVLSALAEHETFTGFGWQAAAGLGIRLSPSIGVLGEAGYHWGSPAQGFLIQGVPVDMKVNLDGAFVRGGLRFTL